MEGRPEKAFKTVASQQLIADTIWTLLAFAPRPAEFFCNHTSKCLELAYYICRLLNWINTFVNSAELDLFMNAPCQIFKHGVLPVWNLITSPSTNSAFLLRR